jgi:hypothetical protein
MAVTLTKMASGANILKYKMTSAGAENADLVAAGAPTPDLLTDCALKAGTPLYDLLAGFCADQAAARVRAFELCELKITVLPRDANAAWVVDANVNVNTFKLNVASAAADALGSYLIIEYRHSEIV